MDPATIMLIVQGIQAAIAAAPGVAEVAVKAKEFIASLFGAELITAEQQDRIFKRVDEVCMAALNFKDPPAWTIEPDPS